MAINATELRGIFTKALVEKLDIQPSPTLFLKGFFKTKITSAKNVSVEVRRNGEPIAVDVLRGTEGNMNRWDRSTEKIITPPYFEESFFLNELDGYDRIFGGQPEVQADTFAMVVAEAEDKIRMLKDKINRRYEVMSAQVLQSGIVALTKTDNIDFNRRAASKAVLAAGDRWSVATVDPDVVLEEGAKFIRTHGLYTGGVFNVIVGSKAWNAFVNNPIRQAKYDIRNFALGQLNTPIQMGAGATLLGQAAAGSNVFNFWGYEQYYNPAETDVTGKLPYVEANQIIMLPDSYAFTFAYAGVPHVKRGSEAMPAYISYASGEFAIDDYIDYRRANHVFTVKSAGIPIPTQVDAIFNKQVVE